MIEKVFYEIESFPYAQINNIPVAKRRKGQRKYIKDKFGKVVFEKPDYLDAIAAFDIETTKIDDKTLTANGFKEPNAVMFIWQFHINFIIDDEEYNYTVLGRTWDEFSRFTAIVAAMIPDDATLLTFVHNFNYEFNYIKSIINFTNKEGAIDIFAMDAHHPITASSHNGKFEWRDSLALFGMKLEKVTKGLTHAKIDGKDFDYTKKRYSWTPLSDLEYQYCINDVYGLTEAIRRHMKNRNDNIYSICKTQTGYIRRVVKQIMYWHIKNNDYPADDYQIYKLLRDSFRGGNTHCNRFFAGDIYQEVYSFDKSSAYPDAIVNERFPLQKFAFTLDRLDNLDPEYAYLIKIRMKRVRLRNEFEPVPYLASAKVEAKVGLLAEDNGRILALEEGTTVINDIDWSIINKQYEIGDVQVITILKSKYGYLPREFREYVKELYVKKTSLKNVEGMEAEYGNAKVDINACYGLMVQKVENNEIEYDEETQELIELPDMSADSIKMSEYIDIARKRPMPYRWGCWVSSYCRKSLQGFIDIVGGDFIYADTDSCKFLNYEDHKEEIDAFNQQYYDRSKESSAFATDPDGDVHYMGFFEDEGVYSEFITMGAKKYGYTNDKGETHITIAGVPKKEGAKELEKAGGLKAFKPGMIFNAGKLRPVYNDEKEYGEVEVTDYNGNKGIVKVTSNVCLVDVEYKLGYGTTYKELLDDPMKWVEDFNKAMFDYQQALDKHNWKP